MNCAIVLAAGLSQRMGTPKLLLPFGESTVIARVVDAFLGASTSRVMVVIRSGDCNVRAALENRPVHFAENPAADGDMLSSVRCGLRALPAAAATILVSPGDQPSLEPTTIRQMLTAFHAGRRSLLVPTRAGRRGHPLVFGARFREEILSSFDGTGLRGLLDAHADEVTLWPTDDPAVTEDLDTPQQYQQALARFADPRRSSSASESAAVDGCRE